MQQSRFNALATACIGPAQISWSCRSATCPDSQQQQQQQQRRRRSPPCQAPTSLNTICTAATAAETGEYPTFAYCCRLGFNNSAGVLRGDGIASTECFLSPGIYDAPCWRPHQDFPKKRTCEVVRDQQSCRTGEWRHTAWQLSVRSAIMPRACAAHMLTSGAAD